MPYDPYVYYRCIRSNYYQPRFYCQRYESLKDLPENRRPCWERTDIPIHRWYPEWYHRRYLAQELQNQIQVFVNKENLTLNKNNKNEPSS